MSISGLNLAVGVPQEVYIRSVAVPVLICKDRIGGPILPNKDGSVGELLLLTTDTTLSYTVRGVDYRFLYFDFQG